MRVFDRSINTKNKIWKVYLKKFCHPSDSTPMFSSPGMNTEFIVPSPPKLKPILAKHKGLRIEFKEKLGMSGDKPLLRKEETY